MICASKLIGSHRRQSRAQLIVITKVINNTHRAIKSTTQQMQKGKISTTMISNNISTTTLGTAGSTATAQGAHILPTPKTATNHYEINIQFTEEQQRLSYYEETLTTTTADQRQLKNVINEKIRSREFFYGLEILAHTYNPNYWLDYNALGPLLPLFTSIVWLGMDYCNIENLNEVEAIRLAQKLNRHVRVMPHLSCYCLTETRLREFLKLNFPNVLSIRGDFFDKDQRYQHSSELVEAIRRIRGDSISIGVAGYPEGHPECKSMEEDLGNLEKKVMAGADFIITQICFSSRPIIDYIKNCRSRNIKIPILVGIFVPDNLRMLETILRLTKIHMPSDDLQEYRRYHDLGEGQFAEYAVRRAVEMIDSILSSDEVEVYGLQFFSMNRFQNIPMVLEKIRKKHNK